MNITNLFPVPILVSHVINGTERPLTTVPPGKSSRASSKGELLFRNQLTNSLVSPSIHARPGNLYIGGVTIDEAPGDLTYTGFGPSGNDFRPGEFMPSLTVTNASMINAKVSVNGMTFQVPARQKVFHGYAFPKQSCIKIMYEGPRGFVHCADTVIPFSKYDPGRGINTTNTFINIGTPSYS